MRIYRLARHVLLLLFTLLQCVAPLAHAHVDGHNAAHSVHIASVITHGADVVFAAQLSLHEHESSVVCMPPEYRSSDLKYGYVFIAGQKILLASPGLIVTQCNDQRLQAFPFFPYQLPCSQAPPAQI